MKNFLKRCDPGLVSGIAAVLFIVFILIPAFLAAIRYVFAPLYAWILLG